MTSTGAPRARQDRLNHVDEREGEHRERSDDAVVDDPEPVVHRSGTDTDDVDQRRAQERVARQDDEVGEERTVGGEDTEGVEVVARDGADNEQRERTERHPPRRAPRRVIAVDAEQKRTDRAESGKAEGDLSGRPDEPERDQHRPDRPDDEVTPRDDEYPEPFGRSMGPLRVLPPGQDRHRAITSSSRPPPNGAEHAAVKFSTMGIQRECRCSRRVVRNSLFVRISGRRLTRRRPESQPRGVRDRDIGTRPRPAPTRPPRPVAAGKP